MEICKDPYQYEFMATRYTLWIHVTIMKTQNLMQLGYIRKKKINNNNNK